MEMLHSAVIKESTSERKNSSDEQNLQHNGLDVDDPNIPHNKLELGGPTSAFSSLYSHAVSGDEKVRNQSSGVHDYENITKFEHPALPTNFFSENKTGIFQDIPVAPAFVQICKYLGYSFLSNQNNQVKNSKYTN